MNQFGLSAESFTAAPKVVGMKQTLKKLASGEMDRVVLSRDCDEGIALQVKEAFRQASGFKTHCVSDLRMAIVLRPSTFQGKPLDHTR